MDNALFLNMLHSFLLMEDKMSNGLIAILIFGGFLLGNWIGYILGQNNRGKER